MSERYIQNHFKDIKHYANIIEKRLKDEDCTFEKVLEDNLSYLQMAQNYKEPYWLIDTTYPFQDDSLL